MINVGINGFGRIGRSIFRINEKNNFFNISVINDINPSIKNLEYMLKYDSTYGIFDKEISSNEKSITINGDRSIDVHHKKNISDVPWEKYETDIIIDSSGIDKNLSFTKELKSKGIKHQIVTNAPDSKKVDKYVILGINESSIDNESFLISSSICDASAVAPVLNVLNEEFGVSHGFLTTLHPWLSYQNLLDGPSRSFAYPGTIIENFALGRSSINTIIPKTTSAIRASEKVLKFLKNRFQSVSFRVPTSIVSTADISVKLKNTSSVNDIMELFKNVETKQKLKIIKNNTEPLVSTDFIGCEYSAIIDHRWTQSNNSNYLKLILWYDNEWGYSSRVLDLVNVISKRYL